MTRGNDRALPSMSNRIKKRIAQPKSATKVSLMKTELVTTLKRQAARIIEELRTDQDPIMITEHGKPAAYLVDVESFETNAKRMKLLEGLARGEKAFSEGRVLTNQEAKKNMGRWLK